MSAATMILSPSAVPHSSKPLFDGPEKDSEGVSGSLFGVVLVVEPHPPRLNGQYRVAEAHKQDQNRENDEILHHATSTGRYRRAGLGATASPCPSARTAARNALARLLDRSAARVVKRGVPRPHYGRHTICPRSS